MISARSSHISTGFWLDSAKSSKFCPNLLLLDLTEINRHPTRTWLVRLESFTDRQRVWKLHTRFGQVDSKLGINPTRGHPYSPLIFTVNPTKNFISKSHNECKRREIIFRVKYLKITLDNILFDKKKKKKLCCTNKYNFNLTLFFLLKPNP